MRHFVAPWVLLALCSGSLGELNVVLSNGVHMPLLGFGTASLENDYEAMSWALDAGYLMVDTASLTHPAYHNSEGRGNSLDLGILLRTRNVRERITVISKNDIWDHGFNSTLRDVQRSLSALQTDYIDSYLIHHPSCFSGRCEGTWKDTWRAMEQLYREGILKSIGVSNFNVALLEELLFVATVQPHLVQNRHDPITPDWEVMDFCQRRGIFFQSFSTLGRQYIAAELKSNPDTPSPVLAHEVVQSIAARHHKTRAQVVLRWALRDRIGVLPKSGRMERIRSNADVFDFELTQSEKEALDGMEKRTSDGAMQVTFSNRGRSHATVFWKDMNKSEEDNLRLVLELKPQSVQQLTTYKGHVFVVKQQGVTLSTHTIVRRGQHIEIDEEMEL